MGLGLLLRTSTRTKEPLAAIETFLTSKFADTVEHLARDENAMVVGLHPAAQDVEFTRDGATLTVDAKTSTAGPGYHAFVCALLKGLERELGGKWEPTAEDEYGDETGFFDTGNKSKLEAEMLIWLRGVCGVISEQAKDGATGLMVSLPTDNQFDFDGVFASPMGPRDEAWLESVRKDPRKGTDLFPWWDVGMGAPYFRGRALSRMWTDVCWRAPLDDFERQLLERIDADLRKAHGMDPALPLPWAEWAEISGWLGADDAVAKEIQEKAKGQTPKVGYRRKPIRTTLAGGWSVLLPGEMAVGVDDQGTWSAFTPGRTVWASTFQMGDPEAPTLSAQDTLSDSPLDGAALAIAELPEDYASRASQAPTEEGGIRITAEVARPHRLAVFTIVIDQPADLEWAKGVVASARLE